MIIRVINKIGRDASNVRLQQTVRLQLNRMISENKAAQAANAPIIFEEAVMIIKIHSENFNVLFYKRSLLNPSNILIIRSLLQMLNKYCTQSVNVIFTLAFYEHLRVAFY